MNTVSTQSGDIRRITTHHSSLGSDRYNLPTTYLKSGLVLVDWWYWYMRLPTASL